MSNRGLDGALENFGVKVERTAVGDRNVAMRMVEIGSNFGGECSGHMIFSDLESTSNGVLSGIMCLNAMKFFGLRASDVQDFVKMYPQEKCSISVKKIIPLEAMPSVGGELKNISDYLEKFNGRLVVRYSGTEPKLRILVESESGDLAKECLEKVKNIIANSPVMH
jgi:phosphoglucosamine mutase